MTATPPVWLLSIGSRKIAVGRDVVTKIATISKVTPVLSSHQSIVGVINLQGGIVPVVNLDVVLGCNPHAVRVPGKMVILLSGQHQLAIPFDEISLGDTYTQLRADTETAETKAQLVTPKILADDIPYEYLDAQKLIDHLVTSVESRA